MKDDANIQNRKQLPQCEPPLPAELRAAMANREILQSTALAFDTQRQLRFELGGTKAVMPPLPSVPTERKTARCGILPC